MNNPPIYDPQGFDAYVNCPDHNSEAIVAQLPTSELGQVRRAQLLFSRGDPSLWRELAASLVGVRAVPARGVSLMIQATMRLYEEVLAVNPDPQGFLPLDLEDACHAHAAIGVAACETGQHHRSLEHLRVALTLARSLGMRYRGQMLEMEWLRVRNLIGDAAPEEIQCLLMQAMPPRRRLWGQRTHAEALMSLGAHRDALLALGSPQQDSSPDADLREWLHAICLLPPAAPGILGDLGPDSSGYRKLAHGIRRLAQGQRDIDLTGVRGEPMATYARIMQAAVLVRTPRLVESASQLLGNEPPARPDQAVSWAISQLGAAVDGAREVPIVATLDVLERELPRLRAVDELVQMFWKIAPDRIMWLLQSPLGRGIALHGLPAQPLLLGQVVACGDEEVRLPGRTGRTLVLEAAQVAVRDELTRSERKRLAEALVGFGGERVVNMGWVLRACGLVRQALIKAGQLERAAEWAMSCAQIQAMLSTDTQSVLSMYPPDYLR